RLTRRLERLQASVERLGGGDLAARVDARGRDEVARLAASFNESAARIERLVQSQRALLANASHELRSPLARVRMAIEMLAEGDAPRRAEIKRELERNVAELDALIDEILLASRLDATDARAAFEEVDLAALAAEECARAEARFELAATGECTLRGDARLLRRLLRNLLDNARRHGGGAEVDVVLRAATDGFELDVCDRGPGVPAAERERIFEPFYRLAGASETAGGVGLGLALVRKIAEQHGGSAVCLPRAGGGSCFRVRLPRG
ncbi:MAG: HAMP domain-containing histidine kinase, partial [Burkholderiaceae bacterium]|nr:HAMP domain-containing histidine kinase [Burkholderiaceae bacterium]